ncbi:MAG: hypothetical protein Kow0059_00080 [Candidatus Sumerlaeia bacterium]
MWSGVPLGALSLPVARRSPVLGMVLLAAALAAALAGAWLKKKYCPRCRAEACARPERR